MFSWAPGAAQTPNINDFVSAQKSCIENQSVGVGGATYELLGWLPGALLLWSPSASQRQRFMPIHVASKLILGYGPGEMDRSPGHLGEATA